MAVQGRFCRLVSGEVGPVHFPSLQLSNVFRAASEIATSQKILHFTDSDIERSVVIRAFLDELSDTPPPLRVYPPIDTYVFLAHFLTKYDCRRVSEKLVDRLWSSLIAKRIRSFEVWAIGAALENLRLCEAAVYDAVAEPTVRYPFKDWAIPYRLKPFIPWPYLSALEDDGDDTTTAVGQPCKTDPDRTCPCHSRLPRPIDPQQKAKTTQSLHSSDTRPSTDSTQRPALKNLVRSFHEARDAKGRHERGQAAAALFRDAFVTASARLERSSRLLRWLAETPWAEITGLDPIRKVKPLPQCPLCDQASETSVTLEVKPEEPELPCADA